MTMLMEDCHRIWNRLIEAADSEIQQQIFHQLWRVAEAADWELGSDDLEDYLLRAPWSEPLRRENLDRLDERIGACKLGDWELPWLLKQEMDRNCERKMYRHTIVHLASLHQYPNGPHAAQSLARYWFQYHKNRPAMKDELRKAGYVET